MANICVIPARGGSQRIPRKNIRKFMGVPIIWYSIEKARATGLFDEIYVSTEDEEIANVSIAHGAKWLQRPVDLADHITGTYAVTLSAVNQLGLQDTDFVCCIYATSPLMRSEDIALGHMYLITLQIAHAISIGYPPLQDAAQFYWSRVDSLRMGVGYFGAATALVIVPPEHLMDINTREDWDKAEQMYMKLMNKPKPTLRSVK